MMGTQSAPAQLFYDLDLDRHVPSNHMLREKDISWDCFATVKQISHNLNTV